MSDDHHQQPEGASRQAIGMLAGGIVGFGVGAQSIFADFANAGPVPWATGLGYALAGCFIGLVLTVLFVGDTPPPEESLADVPPPIEDEIKPDHPAGIQAPLRSIRPKSPGDE